MKCIHHTDDDGLCAAAIVRFYLKDKMEEPSDFIAYSHGMELKLPENLTEGETWYIVDLALDPTIYTTIVTLLMSGCKVVHIDHHKSGIDYYENLSDAAKETIKEVVRFYDVNGSGCLLTFLYANMDDDEREHPMDVDMDLSPIRHKFMMEYNGTRQVGDIPFVIRYINDWDIQEGVLKEAIPFHYGFANMYEDKNPCADIWKDLFTKERWTINPIVQKGDAFVAIYEKENAKSLKRGFETEICGVKCFATNSTSGDCRMFNSIKDKYPMFCKFSYDGSIEKWTYFFVSGKDNGVDVSEIAATFGGGGHAAAAGAQLPYNIFGIITADAT